MKIANRLAAAMVLTLAPLTAAAGETPSAAPQTGAELAALIECRGGLAAYNALARELTGSNRSGALRRLGLKAARSPNPFLAEYRLAAPLTVFGRAASRIAFNSAGVFALLDEADPHPLAKALGIAPEFDTPAKFMGEKLVREDEERLAGDDVTLTSRVTLNVSTVSSHPGTVLAGCGYRMEVE